MRRRVHALEKATSSSDQDERLRALEKAVSSSDQDTRLRALEKAASAPAVLTKTPAFDHAELLRHKDALDGVYRELDALKGDRDGIYRKLDALQRARDNIYTEMDELKDHDCGTADRTLTLERDLQGLEEHVRLPRDHGGPRWPSPSQHETASDQDARLDKTVDELSARVDRIVKDMGWV